MSTTEQSAIQWTHWTFNPWRGCTKVSDGCKFCYAEKTSKRNPSVLGVWGPNGERVIAAESYWKQPLKWNEAARASGERHRVFCASLADVFEGPETMPKDAWPKVQEARLRLWDLIYKTPHLDWLLLTKRPENILGIIGGESGAGISFLDSNLKNVWLGTSVENQEMANERIPHLLKCPATVRFLSCEPLLGPIELCLGDSEGEPTQREPFRERNWLLHWVIVGGESGPNARPCYTSWIDDIVVQCRSADIACFVKQLGSNHRCIDEEFGDQPIPLIDPKGGDISEFPADLRIREFPARVGEENCTHL